MKGVKFDAGSAVCGAVGGLLVGGVLGWLLHRHVSDARLEAEIEEVKSYYKARANEAAKTVALATHPGKLVADPDSFVPMVSFGFAEEDASGDSSEDGGDASSETPEDGAVLVRPESVEDVRNPQFPYVISIDEFSEDFEKYQKITLNYYAEDDVLADDKDVPIRDAVGLAGAFKTKFGDRSGDPHIVFIRNERLESDFEITLDERAFTEVVLGYGNPNSPTIKKIPPRE